MLSIIGLITVFIAAYFIYRTAGDTNRNALGWALLTLAVGFGLQIVLPLVIVIVIAATMMIAGKPLKSMDDLPWSTDIIITLVGLAASFVGILLIMRRVSIFWDEETSLAPPAPPTFDGK